MSSPRNISNRPESQHFETAPRGLIVSASVFLPRVLQTSYREFKPISQVSNYYSLSSPLVYFSFSNASPSLMQCNPEYHFPVHLITSRAPSSTSFLSHNLSYDTQPLIRQHLLKLSSNSSEFQQLTQHLQFCIRPFRISAFCRTMF